LLLVLISLLLIAWVVSKVLLLQVVLSLVLILAKSQELKAKSHAFH